MHIAAAKLDKVQDALMRARGVLTEESTTTNEREEARRALVVAESFITEAKDGKAEAAEIERARVEHANGSDDCIEVDEDAGTSRAEDGSGLWVQAWVWLPALEACDVCGRAGPNPCDACLPGCIADGEDTAPRYEVRQGEDVNGFGVFDTHAPDGDGFLFSFDSESEAKACAQVRNMNHDQAAKLREDARALDTGMDPELVRELHAAADALDPPAPAVDRLAAMESALYRLKDRDYLSAAQVRAVDDFMSGVGAEALADLFDLVRHHAGPTD